MRFPPRLRAALSGPSGGIGRRMTILIIAFSSAIMLVITVVQLALEYRDLRTGLDRELDSVEIYVRSISGSVWNFDDRQVQLALEGLSRLPSIDRASVLAVDTGKEWQAGSAPSQNHITRVYDLHAVVRGRETVIGRLTVDASLDRLYHQIAIRAVSIVVSNGLKAAFVAVFILYLFRRLVARRLDALAGRVRSMGLAAAPADPSASPEPPAPPERLDELGVVEWALERTASRLERAGGDIRAREQANERALQRLNEAQRIGRIGDWELDLATQATSWSPQMFEILGRDPRLGPPRLAETAAMFEPASRALREEKIALAIESGEAQHYELAALRPGGERVQLQAIAVPRKDESGKVVGLYGTVQDITMRKDAEAALRRAHEMAKVAHIVTGPGGEFESWSSTLPRLIGFGPEALPRSTREWLARIHPDDRARFRSTAIEAAVSHARADLDYRLQRGDGEWIHLRQAIEPMEERVDAGQAASHWFTTLQDVSEQKQAERKIRAQLEHLGLLDQITRSTGERLDLQSVFQIVLIRLEDSLPIDFGCACLHDPVANTLRVTCVGAKSVALARELTLEEHATIDIDANGLARCIQGHLVYEPEIDAVRHPFPERLARGGLGSLVMAPLKSESRVFGALIAARRKAHAFTSAECEFLRQVSEHVALAAHQAQLHGSLQQAYDDLRQTQQVVMQEERLRALGQMASGIAHDINNALSPVSLYVESMLETERGLSGRGRGYLETIQRAVEDVAQTVARLREFYRQRERQLALAPVRMNDLAQQVLDLTRARWRDMPQERGIGIRALTELAPDLPEVMGVESEIREALTNLVFNAVDAMPEGGTLTLRTRLAHAEGQQHAAVAVEVVDTGAGMDEETRRRCLEPFFTTKGERGTGLGLAMVFGMAQRHGAELEIDSAPGAGTTVRLMFAVAAAVDSSTAEPAAGPVVPGRLRLLLIDDDPILLKSLREALETDGHLIVTANGGEAGISAFRAALERREPFAAVLTDLGMPYVDGRKVAAAVKEAAAATPVILLTGWGQRMVAEDDIPAHVDRVLAKPPRLRELREALAQLWMAKPSSGDPGADLRLAK